MQNYCYVNRLLMGIIVVFTHETITFTLSEMDNMKRNECVNQNNNKQVVSYYTLQWFSDT